MWSLRDDFMDGMREQGIRLPTDYLVESEAIVAMQKCDPWHGAKVMLL